MNKKSIINFSLVFVSVTLLAIFAFTVKLHAAADSVAVLRTMGMTCGSCAGRIEKTLKSHPGVSSVEVDLDGGRVIVAYDSKVAKPEKLAESVTGAGYGSSILQTLSADEYKSQTGKSVATKSGGCGGRCCGK